MAYADPERAKAYRRKWMARWRETHRDVDSANSRAWAKRNPEKLRARNKAWVENNKERAKATRRAWCEKNRESIRQRMRKWRDDNRVHFRANAKKRHDERVRSDLNYRMSYLLRRRIRGAITHHKKSNATAKLTGCSLENLKIYLETRFVDGMTWGKFMTGEIHLDHIIPLSLFDLSRPEQQRYAFHFSNLQPMWASENMSKSDRVYSGQLSFL